MYSLEDRKRAVALYMEYDLSAADTIRELGYPSRITLKMWYREFIDSGKIHDGYRKSKPKYSVAQKREAVDYYLGHGRSLSRTVRALGYPTKQALRVWVDELAPGERKISTNMTKGVKSGLSFERKKSAVVDLCSRSGAAKDVAEAHGTNRDTLYRWKYELLGKEAMPARHDGDRSLPDDLESLEALNEELKGEVKDLELQIYKLRMEKDILEATVEIVKKDPGADPVKLINKEKATLIDALKTIYPLHDLLGCLDMAKSSYYYQRSALASPDKYTDVRARIRELFEASNSVYGYRRIHGDLGNEGVVVSEKVVRRIMAEGGMVVLAKRRRKYSSFKGDISPEAPNLVKRDFNADGPNELWLTDITEFHIPAGKVYLSPVLDCFDGMLVSWTIGTSPDAELANTMLDLAISTLGEGEHPVVHSDYADKNTKPRNTSFF